MLMTYVIIYWCDLLLDMNSEQFIWLYFTLFVVNLEKQTKNFCCLWAESFCEAAWTSLEKYSKW